MKITLYMIPMLKPTPEEIIERYGKEHFKKVQVFNRHPMLFKAVNTSDETKSYISIGCYPSEIEHLEALSTEQLYNHPEFKEILDEAILCAKEFDVMCGKDVYDELIKFKEEHYHSTEGEEKPSMTDSFETNLNLSTFGNPEDIKNLSEPIHYSPKVIRGDGDEEVLEYLSGTTETVEGDSNDNN